MATGLFAHGTQLQIGDGGTPTEVFTAIPLLGDISYTEPVPSKIKIPDHSDGTGYTKYIQGLKDGGKVSCKVSLNPAQVSHATLWAAHGTIVNFQLVPPPSSSDTKYRAFPGLVSLAHAFGEDKEWSGTLTIDIMGAVTKQV